ncbi:MAG: thermonuclease family protein [Deltaproteobacteria bacterium]|nr:MAG: thermonuclease family protein [Deltaproteobacteria bacterium]
MNRKNLLGILLIGFISLSFAHSAYNKVQSVYDGDTILLETGEKVRYLGINAPEMDYEGKKSEFLAITSRDYNSRLVNKKRVRLEFDQEKRDHYGRLLAYVFLEGGDMVNALLLRQGFAHVMVKRPNLKYLSLLLDDQRMAMKARLGIWSQATGKMETYYLGNDGSYRFHRPACSFAAQIRPDNVLRFESRHKAFWEGFSPCKRCRP